MPKYRYQARTQKGSIVTGVLELPDQRALREHLRLRNLVPISIEEQRKDLLKEVIKYIPFLKPKVSSKELAVFSRQFSTIVSSGVPIVEGLGILIEQIQSKELKRVLGEVKSDIETGTAISQALKKHTHVFSDLYVAMVEAGEVGGKLDEILDRLAGYLEKSEALKGKLVGALTYPAVVATFAIGAVTFMLTFVIPRFVDMFKEMDATLPELTLIVIDLANFIKGNIIYIIIILIAAITIIKKLYRKNEKVRYYIDDTLLNLSVFGPILRKVAISKFTRTFATLIKSGVPILECMEVVAKTSGNAVIEKAVLKARDSIKEGERISEPLKKVGVFPPMVTQMISVGEETGNLDEMLTKISDFYDREVDDALAALTSMIEPLIIIMLGGAIGVIVVSLFLPMFELVSKISTR